MNDGKESGAQEVIEAVHSSHYDLPEAPEFRPSPIEYQAFRVGYHQIPGWLGALINRSNVEAKGTFGYLILNTASGVPEVAQHGDWIVLEQGGNLFVYDDETFSYYFDEVEEMPEPDEEEWDEEDADDE